MSIVWCCSVQTAPKLMSLPSPPQFNLSSPFQATHHGVFSVFFLISCWFLTSPSLWSSIPFHTSSSSHPPSCPLLLCTSHCFSFSPLPSPPVLLLCFSLITSLSLSCPSSFPHLSLLHCPPTSSITAVLPKVCLPGSLFGVPSVFLSSPQSPCNMDVALLSWGTRPLWVVREDPSSMLSQ